MKIPYFSLFIVLFFSKICFSQSHSIKGILTDENQQPIAFANVVLVDLDDINIIKGVITDGKGVFNLKNTKQGDYVLKIGFLGFEEYITRVELYRDIDFENIILKEAVEQLKGVVVTAKRPTIKRLVDRTIFNVENSTLSNSNMLDVLKHAPGVLINNNTLSVKGETPTVYINDRKIYLSPKEVTQLLEGTSANNIKSVEVITTPPAKYDAEDGAILNITMSKNIVSGYNGSISGNYKQGKEYPKYAFSTSHFLKTKKLNVNLNYTISPKKEYVFSDESINFINDDNAIFSSWETDFEQTNKSANQNINANIDFSFNDKNSLGFSSNILVAPRNASKGNLNSNTLVFNSSKTLDSIFNTKVNLVEEKFNFAFTLDYIHKFNKDGEQISLSSHHTNYDFSNFQNVDTGYFFPEANSAFRENKFQTFSSQEIQIFTNQLDYELPLQDSGFIEAGLKVSNINSENVLNQFDFENDIKTQNLENSDTFLYDETNYAAYGSYSKDWSSWSLKSGLRLEYTDTKGSSLATNEVNNNNYFKFFPSIHLKHTIDDKNEVYINYTKRIYRPRYSQLNPFKYFYNDNSYVSGDPNLKPQIDDEVIFGYLYNDKHNFEIFYRNEDSPIVLVVFQDNENNLIKYINTNIDNSISYGVYYGTFLEILNNWEIGFDSQLFYYDNKFSVIEGIDAAFNSNKWTTYVEFTNYVSLLKDNSLNIDVSFLYISPWTEGPSLLGKRSSLDIALRKTLWKNRASVSLGINDAFNNYNYSKTSKYLNQDIYNKTVRETRLFTFGFSYKFGNYRLTPKEREDNISERNRINKKD